MEISYIFFNLFLILFVFFLNKPLSNLINISDIPNKRKSHKKPIPLIGGIIIFIIILINFLFFKKINDKIFYLSTAFFIIGLIDDKFSLSAKIRLFFLSIFSYFYLSNFTILNIAFLNFEDYGKIYLFLQASIFFTILCLLLFQNSMNMIDGINGLSGGIFTILFLFIFFKSNYEIIYLIIVFTLILFLIFNFKNKFFMGDSGIYFLSIFFGLLIIDMSNKNLIYSEEIFLLMSIPGIDMLRLFVIRIINKKNPFKADRFHIHHLLIKKTKSEFITLLIILTIISIPILLNVFFDLKLIYLILLSLILYFVTIIKVKGLSPINK
mgnify:CR=1 FL=1